MSPSRKRLIERLSNLRHAAENAAGAMRRAANDLDNIANMDPLRRFLQGQFLQSSPEVELDIRLAADRLRFASILLVLEVNAASPRTASKVAEVGHAAIALAGPVMLVGAESVVEEIAGYFVKAREPQASASECLVFVEQQALNVLAPDRLGADIDDARLELLALADEIRSRGLMDSAIAALDQMVDRTDPTVSIDALANIAADMSTLAEAVDRHLGERASQIHGRLHLIQCLATQTEGLLA